MDKNLPTAAIIGRSNVGKSTLFNRLIEKRISIMHDDFGVTRDRVIQTCEWLGRQFNLIDSGGFSRDLNLSFQAEINTQVEIAISEADVIIFLVSGVEGLNNEDVIISNMLKRLGKKIILVVNKSDNLEMTLAANNFYSLGVGEPIAISSVHGIGISMLLDKLIETLPEKTNTKAKDYLRIGFVGKPNVGKSTLVNALLNDERVIVSKEAGTTRDAIDTLLKVNNENIILTDTAGIKRNKKSLDDVEWYAELRTHLTILNSDITILLLDHTQKITQIDEKIMGSLKEEYKPVIVAVNKVDQLNNEDKRELEEGIRTKFKFAPWVPIMFISALERKNIIKLLKKAKELNELSKIQINKSSLNNFLMEIQMIKKPPRHNGIEIKLNYITYSNIKFPHFIIFSNRPNWVHFSYIRFIENQIRNVFELGGIPIKISIKGKNNGNRE